MTGLNEGSRDAQVSREVDLAYLSCTDPDAKKRTWSWVFDQVLQTKSKDTDNYRRWSVAIQDKAFKSIRTIPLIDTRSEHFPKSSAKKMAKFFWGDSRPKGDFRIMGAAKIHALSLGIAVST